MAAALNPADLGRRAEAMIEELAAISAEPDRLVRFFLSPEHRRAANLVAQWMREVGLDVFEDAIGNVRGRIGKPPYLVIGSHIDTVIDAGRYDGPLGVVAPILAVDTLQRKKSLPVTGIELVAFGDEEGSRFPSTLPSSAALAGHFDPRHWELTDQEGVTFADALRAYGKSPDDVGKAAIRRGDAAAYVEIHIEQGPVLEAEGEPLGVVSAIVGQTRLQATVTGEAGHAGTVPMKLRRDALAGAAEMVLLAEKIAHDFASDGVVATVGRIEARPSAANIIAGVARFTLDLRTASDAARHTAVERFEREARAIADRRGLGFAIEPIHRIATTPCDASVQNQLSAAIEAVGAKPLRLPSGAGHDGLMMAKLCPIGMLFVRCKGGVSHNPAEYASPLDMGIAVAALVRFVEQFKPPAS
ncbi:MAG: allantoate amidohydrolase [Xanthobacteraceae bacterium]